MRTAERAESPAQTGARPTRQNDGARDERLRKCSFRSTFALRTQRRFGGLRREIR
jgi:hypothetical protein